MLMCNGRYDEETYHKRLTFYATLVSLKVYLNRGTQDNEDVECAKQALLESELINSPEYENLKKWIKKCSASKQNDMEVLTQAIDEFKI